MSHKSRSLVVLLAGLPLLPALGCGGEVRDLATATQALCPADDPDCNAQGENVYSLSVTLLIPDLRSWCTASTARVACDGGGAAAPLQHARVQIRNSATYAVIKTVTTDADGHLQTSLPAGTTGIYFTTDFSGVSSGGKAFQVFYNAKVSKPSCLQQSANRKVIYGASTASTCSGLPGIACNLGSKTMPLSANEAKWAGMTFLNLIYAYRDSALYAQPYHDYCRLSGCGSEDTAFHVVSIYDPAAAQAEYEAGNTSCVYNNEADNSTNWTSGGTGFSTLVGSTNNLDGGVTFHELGHSLHAWALQLQSATSGSYTPNEAWANFVSHAHKSRRDAAHVYFDGVDIEEGNPLTRCSGAPEACGLNWQAALWDLYDTHIDAPPSCEVANSGGQEGDLSSVSFRDMLDGVAHFTSYSPDTQNHALREDEGATNSSTRNVVDYAYNIAAANGLSYTPICQTAVYHNCIQALPTN